MTHFPNIHLKAEQIVRDSRGRKTMRDAYRELSDRSRRPSPNYGQTTVDPKAFANVETPRHAWQQRADLA